jgi:hypothetical protein
VASSALSWAWIADTAPPDPTSLFGWVQTGGIIGLLSFLVLAYTKEWIVPGSRYRRAEEEGNELRVFLRDQAMPTLIRVQDVIVKILEERAWDERAQRNRPKS